MPELKYTTTNDSKRWISIVKLLTNNNSSISVRGSGVISVSSINARSRCTSLHGTSPHHHHQWNSNGLSYGLVVRTNEWGRAVRKRKSKS